MDLNSSCFCDVWVFRNTAVLKSFQGKQGSEIHYVMTGCLRTLLLAVKITGLIDFLPVNTQRRLSSLNKLLI